jgi:hypothetical protein
LVRLTARAFYDDISMKGDNQPKTSRGDNRGMAVVVLDSLTRYQREPAPPSVFWTNSFIIAIQTSV